ncbi:MAG: class I SAM-dependent methyltransferase [Candidatus Abyssobacteria bacterium SURF_5]|uniref:Class I SAM-dependent methyltransferase n=1 Tax=Abyssobacteria bacterium (strain SURF_5) TaxID=2093360 RepID=A0A3A4NF73_ABYX5|nr:MAG: class I SAM-dependent methyltransferase [Candidatus Abyssubacteria bacterium SURF_5]
MCREYLQKFIAPSASVVDLGAGTCEFINNITCSKKYAVDLNPDTANFAAEGVQVIKANPDAPLELDDGAVDVVFASNFFEHLSSRQQIIDMLADIRRVLAPNGKLIVVQPNIKYLYTHYWDYFDHQIALSDESMREAIVAAGLIVEVLKGRFLPYTFRSRFPKGSFFVKTYLRFPCFHRIFGKQMFIVARKP